jgi:hypothetical protein
MVSLSNHEAPPPEVAMADIVNLRQVRKGKARADKAVQAEQNRALFGRTKAEKQRDAAEKTKADQHLDAHKRED